MLRARTSASHLGWNFLFAQLLLILLSEATIRLEDIASELDRPIPIKTVYGIVGKMVTLPCSMIPDDPNDAVAMVLWFKASDGEPLYSFDVRGKALSDAVKWSSPDHFDLRAFFRVATTPAELVVHDIRLSDEGIYRCRVDFRNSPTRNQKVNLSVIVPPEKPIIYDGNRRDKAKLVETFNEGEDVVLVCEVRGGRPRPEVSWFFDNRMVDKSYEQRKKDDLTVNHLIHPKIERKYLKTQVVCQASNNNIEPPASQVVTLDLNLKPTSVQIIKHVEVFTADKKYEVKCKTSGSRPDPVITWYKGNKQMKKIAEAFTDSTGVTISVLSFTPVIDDDEKLLTCRAENPWMSASMLEDSWRLTVQYVPLLSLRIGANLNPDDIKEGDDVYFECTVKANPKPYKLTWYHNGKEMHHNTSAGVVLSDLSLVLQKVTRKSAGDYTCLAANVEGKGMSNSVSLRVMYAPVCKDDREELYGALKQETVSLRCEVDANPPLVTFHWTFNSSGDLNNVTPSKYTYSGTTSYLNYTPTFDMDYGTLACWGTNSVGRQRTPCMFQVVAAGHPFALTNCTITNQTSDSLHVECVENFDGGLPQSFLVELLELPDLILKRNLTVSKAPPVFDIYGLEPGTSFQVNLFAVNAKGRSEPFVIETVTFKGVAKYTGATAEMQMSPVLTALIASASALVIIVCLVFLALYHRSHTRTVSSKQAVVLVSEIVEDTRPTSFPLPLNSNLSDHRIQDDTDPDLIPNKHGKEWIMIKERKPLKGVIKKYRTPPQRRRKKKEDSEEIDNEGEEDDEREGERTALNVNHCNRYSPRDSHQTFTLPATYKVCSNGGSGTLRVHKGVTATSPLGSSGDMVTSTSLTNSLHLTLPSGLSPSLCTKPFKVGHEVVTTSNRLQESCI